MREPLEGECKLLRIFSDSSTRWRGEPLGEALVLAARKAGLAGASLFDGVEGFRAGGQLLTDESKAWRLKAPRETLVEIVDEAARIDAFLENVREMLSLGAVVSVERAFVPAMKEL